MFLSQFEAETIIKPYENLFIECVLPAWRKYWSQNFDDIRHAFTPRTRANIMHDLMILNAQDKFAGIKNVKLHHIGGVFFIEINRNIFLRFKKLNENKMPSNIPTQQTRKLLYQEELPGMLPHPTILVVGYELNRFQIDIRAVTITCPNGSTNAWDFELNMTSGEILEVTELITGPPPTPIRPKINRKEKLEGTNE